MKANKSKTSKRIFRWLFSGVIILILLLPYPFEVGGPFKFLSVRKIEVHSQVSGEIKEVLIKEGDWVQDEQTLAFLNPREHQKNLDVVTANIDKAKADLKLLEAGPKLEEVEKAIQQVNTAQKRYEYSKREAERLKNLHETGVIPEEEYLEAAKIADVDSENMEVVKANLKLVESGARPEEIEAQKALIRDLRSRVKYYEENLQLTELKAPMSGYIVTPYLEAKVGQMLQSGDLFCIIQDFQKIQAEISLPEVDIGEADVGSRVKVKLWAYPTRKFFGKVISIAPLAEDTLNGRVVRVLTEFENDDQIFKPEMTGEAKINGGKKPVIIAFTRAIVRFFMVEIWSWFP